MDISQNGMATFDNILFNENQCEYGCIAFSNSPFINLNIRNSRIYNNTANVEGALASISQSGNSPAISQFSVTDSFIEGNYAKNGRTGLIYADSEALEVLLKNTMFDQNLLLNIRDNKEISIKAGLFYLQKC